MVRVKISLLSLFILFLTACNWVPYPPSFMMKNSITFDIYDELKKGEQAVYKNTWPACGNFNWGTIQNGKKPDKYLTHDSTCKVSPEGHVPREIVIEYAPWLTYGQQVEAGMGNSRTHFNLDNLSFEQRPPDEVLIAYDDKIDLIKEAAIDKLPASAWKRIVLHPQELVRKYRFSTPPLPKRGGDRLRGKEINYIITLNPDGSYTVEDKLTWVSPYSDNWN